MKTGTFTQRLAENVSRIDPAQMPADKIQILKGMVFDSLGGIIGAWRSGELNALVDNIASSGGLPQATLWTDGRQLPAPTVALILGILGSHFEYSGSDSAVVPAFVLGEVYNRSGMDVIGAMIAADDTSVRKLFASEYEAHKLHWPAQTMAYSATAAACKIARADTARTAAALSLVGCLTPIAPFEAFIQGAGVKDFYNGWPFMLGLLAEQWTKAGCGGPINLIEGNRGLGQTWFHRAVTPEEMEAALPVAPGSGVSVNHYKYFASNLSAQTTLTVLQNMMQDHPEITAEQVESVEVLTYDYALALSKDSPADSRISAHVSIPYLVAAMIMDGEVGPEQTNAAHLEDSNLRKLAARVRLGQFPGASGELRRRSSRPAQVTVFLKDGRSLTASETEPRWAVSHPASDAEVEQKFRRLVGDALQAKQLEEVVDMIWRLETLPSIRDLIERLPFSS